MIFSPPPLQPPGTEAGNIGRYMPHAEQQPTHPGRRVAPSMRQNDRTYRTSQQSDVAQVGRCYAMWLAVERHYTGQP